MHVHHYMYVQPAGSRMVNSVSIERKLCNNKQPLISKNVLD